MARFRYCGLSALLCACLAACSAAKDADTATVISDAPQGQSAPVAGNTSGPANAATVPTNPRSMALNVQGAAPIGVTVRVKDIEMGADATVLTVSASYGGSDTNSVHLAAEPTFLEDESGNRLMLKQPLDNPDLDIVHGQQMDGKLVFLGAVPTGTRKLRLVFNKDSPGDSIISPGLIIPISLDAATQ